MEKLSHAQFIQGERGLGNATPKICSFPPLTFSPKNDLPKYVDSFAFCTLLRVYFVFCLLIVA